MKILHFFAQKKYKYISLSGKRGKENTIPHLVTIYHIRKYCTPLLKERKSEIL
jgi:hypothetical protein